MAVGGSEKTVSASIENQRKNTASVFCLHRSVFSTKFLHQCLQAENRDSEDNVGEQFCGLLCILSEEVTPAGSE